MPRSQASQGMTNSKAWRSSQRQTCSAKVLEKYSVFMMYLCINRTTKLPFSSRCSFRLSRQVYMRHLPMEKSLK